MDNEFRVLPAGNTRAFHEGYPGLGGDKEAVRGCSEVVLRSCEVSTLKTMLRGFEDGSDGEQACQGNNVTRED